MIGGAGGSVPDISPEDLGELMGEDQQNPDSPAEAPGMSIEGADEDTVVDSDGGWDDENTDDAPDEEEE